MRLSIGTSRTDKQWKQVDWTWPQFIEEARRHTSVGTETHAEYMAMTKAKQDQLKDNGGFVAASLAQGRRKRGCCTSRCMITLDIDNAPAGATEALCETVKSLGCDYLIYSTRKHDSRHPRLRVILPLDRPASADEYQPLARAAAQVIDQDMKMLDPTTFEAERLMYWPSASSDSQTVFINQAQGKALSTDALLSTYADWHDATEWPLCPAESAPKRPGGKQADPTQKQGLVGAFCRVYDVPAAIAKFIPETYTDAGTDRYTFTKGSTTAGAVLYDSGNFLYSHHSTDPAGGRLVNAWDLVRIHRFGSMDADAQPDTPTHSLPSYAAMAELAMRDPDVYRTLSDENLQHALEGFTPQQEEAPDEDWHSRLEVNAKGQLLASSQNMRLLIHFDELLRGKVWDDLFAQRRKCTGPLPWDKRTEERWWSDTDDAGLRWYFESVHHITGAGKIADAVALEAQNAARDPVVDYLNSLHWDEVPRVETLFSDYLGAEDNEYTRAVARKCLAAAVTRAFHPGAKYDQVVIFSGPQGIGKSTLVAHLGQNWFSDSLTCFGTKDARESIRGVWLVELGELTAFDKSENEAAKQFISQREDVYRPSYGRNTVNYPRRCIFFGTSNKIEFLRDSTGNRRFWPIDTDKHPPRYDIKVLGEANWLPQTAVDQIWAEAVEIYKSGEPLYFKGDTLELAQEEQAAHMEVDPWMAKIQAFLEKEVPADWRNSWDADRREQWANGIIADKASIPTAPRDYTCVAEIWEECLSGRIERITPREQRRITACLEALPEWQKTNTVQRFAPYGRQKAWHKNP